jgi:hypothetical protein
MKTSVKLDTTKSLPVITITIADENSTSELATITSSFCYFRHYDWCWNWNEGDQGYTGGMNICNGGSFEFPYGDKPSYDTIIRVSLAAAIERWHGEMIDESAKIREKGRSAESFLAWEGEIKKAFQVAKPAFEQLAIHAIANPSPHFSALSHPDARGGRLINTRVHVSGFTPEACWSGAEAIVDKPSLFAMEFDTSVDTCVDRYKAWRDAGPDAGELVELRGFTREQVDQFIARVHYNFYLRCTPQKWENEVVLLKFEQ